MGNGRPAVLHLLVPEIADMGGQFGIMVADGINLPVLVTLELCLDCCRTCHFAPWAHHPRPPPHRNTPHRPHMLHCARPDTALRHHLLPYHPKPRLPPPHSAGPPRNEVA